MGKTGLATAAHLHLEFRINGKRVNPEVTTQKNGGSVSELIVEKNKTSFLATSLLKVFRIYVDTMYLQTTLSQDSN
jgi:murein DD-endopeptidase MepM/ murein hydrolase activator NlpD